ncbi:three component ABC system middle component [Pectobacterium versatile]|uniref:three component ABC system middle component n=1 Tax=Pectobacterium versatile TaxID=2488639 RepID=UPI00380FC660
MNIYNNELLGIFSLQEVLSRLNETNLTNLMLVLPVIFHKKSLNYLSHKRTNVISFQDLLLTKPELLVSLNKRYYNFLPSSLNCISLCIENEIFELINDKVVFKKKIITDAVISTLGKRAIKIQSASLNIATLISDNAHNIYDLCGVKL